VQKKIEIMIAGRSKPAIAGLQAALSNPDVEIKLRHISNGHSNPLYGIEQSPDILVFHLSDVGEDEISSLLENPENQRPTTLIVGPADNVNCMRLAMQAGVRDYLQEPLDESELQTSVARICHDIQISMAADNHEGRMTAIVSAKGGSGASFLAANLAHLAASESDYNVALLDLDLQFGSLGQYLDLVPEHGLMHALDMADHLDSVAIDAYMAKHRSGLRLLSPLEDEIILPRDVMQDRFGKLLDLLKSSYGRTFIDLPRQIDELSADVYERSDDILLVTQQELASIRDARRLYKLIMRELSIPAERVSLVINRYDKSSVVELDDICRSTGIDKSRLILVPNSYQSVAESINVGVPMYDHAKNSRVTKALIEMNAKLGGGPDLTGQKNVVRRVLSNLIGG
jgi:pilus assembly protein CpaE